MLVALPLRCAAGIRPGRPVRDVHGGCLRDVPVRRGPLAGGYCPPTISRGIMLVSWAPGRNREAVEGAADSTRRSRSSTRGSSIDPRPTPRGCSPVGFPHENHFCHDRGHRLPRLTHAQDTVLHPSREPDHGSVPPGSGEPARSRSTVPPWSRCAPPMAVLYDSAVVNPCLADS